MPDGYELWRARLAGDTLMDIPINEPQFGFWLRRYKSRAPTVIAIFPNGQEIYATEIDRDGGASRIPWEHNPAHPRIPTILEMWPYISQRPVSEAQWEFYKEHKRLPEEVGPGHNEAPIPEAIADQIHAATEEAMREIAGGIETQLQADRAANHRDRLIKLKDAADEERSIEKKPHIAAARAVDDRWRDCIAEATNAVMFLRNALTPFLRAQKQAAQEAAPETEVKAKAGTGRRRTGLRTVVTAQVNDWEAAAVSLVRLDNADIKEEIQRLANKVYAAGGTLDGCDKVETEKAQ